MAQKINEDGKAFVESIMRDVGAENATRLAEMLYGPNVSLTDARKVGRWASGIGGAPNMQGTLDLLRLAGRLVEAPTSSRRRRALDDDAMLRALNDLADLQERQDELLFGLLDRAIGQRPPQRTPRRRRSG